MNMDWQKVNWFSKLLALGLFVFVLFVAFIFGMSYQQSIGEISIVSRQTNSFSNQSRTTSLSTDSMAWQTYRNDKYGFSFQYPSNLYAQEDDGSLILFHEKPTGEEEPGLSITIDPNPQNLSLRDYYNGKHGVDLFGTSNGFTTRHVGGVIAYEFVPYVSFAGEVDVIIPHGHEFIFFNDIGSTFQSQGIFDKILSTVKFSESLDATYWQTYRNDEYGFEIQLPQDWTVERAPFKDDAAKLRFVSAATKQADIKNVQNCSWQGNDVDCLPDGIALVDIEFTNSLSEGLVPASDVKSQNINGVVFNVFLFEEVTGETFYETKNEQYLYSFNTLTGTGNDFIKSILSTFKFITSLPLGRSGQRIALETAGDSLNYNQKILLISADSEAIELVSSVQKELGFDDGDLLKTIDASSSGKVFFDQYKPDTDYGSQVFWIFDIKTKQFTKLNIDELHSLCEKEKLDCVNQEYGGF